MKINHFQNLLHVRKQIRVHLFRRSCLKLNWMKHFTLFLSPSFSGNTVHDTCMRPLSAVVLPYNPRSKLYYIWNNFSSYTFFFLNIKSLTARQDKTSLNSQCK
jgi:hypothetical protein